MICTTLQHHTLEEILNLLENKTPAIEMAEIRLDRCPLDEDGIETLFSSSDTPLIATCRVAGDGSGTWSEAERKLLRAIEAGAAFVDLEIEAPKEMGKKIRRVCSEYGTQMIRSCHFFDSVPSTEELQAISARCHQFGGEIVKIAAMAESQEDVDRLMDLYRTEEPGRLVAFAMGEYGRESRIDCLRKGSPLTYAALTEEEAAAPGQWCYEEMLSAVYGSRRPLGSGKEGTGKTSGETTVLNIPASKSFAQRAILAAALAEGTSHLGGYAPCGDNESALEVARSLGAKVTVEGSTVTIEGIGSPSGIHCTKDSLVVGESGLLTRLMIPVVSAVADGTPVEIQGKGTLLGRPLKGASEMMAQFGTVLRPVAADGSNGQNEIKVPLSVQGPLLAGKADISGKAVRS
jgi:3-dehydroquinate dehydratase